MRVGWPNSHALLLFRTSHQSATSQGPACLPACLALSPPLLSLQPQLPPTPPTTPVDFYCTVDKVKGQAGEDRVVITFNGKASRLWGTG